MGYSVLLVVHDTLHDAVSFPTFPRTSSFMPVSVFFFLLVVFTSFTGGLFRGLWCGWLVFVCFHCYDESRGVRVGSPPQSTIRHCLLHAPHAPLR